jgi:hypothetical protein
MFLEAPLPLDEWKVTRAWRLRAFLWAWRPGTDARGRVYRSHGSRQSLDLPA